MQRTIRFLLEALAAIVLGGLVLGALIPLLRNFLEPLPRLVFQVLVIAVLTVCVLAATLRPGGSLRR
jgi:hypothetical protein